MANSAFDLTLKIIRSKVLKSTQINMIFSYKNYNNKRHLKPLLFSNFLVKPRVRVRVRVRVRKPWEIPWVRKPIALENRGKYQKLIEKTRFFMVWIKHFQELYIN